MAGRATGHRVNPPLRSVETGGHPPKIMIKFVYDNFRAKLKLIVPYYMQTHKTLVLLTSEFPYGNGETFLETEIQYLAQTFEQIIVLSSAGNRCNIRKLPENCKTIYLSRKVSAVEKLFSLIFIFHPLIWKEIQTVRNIYKLRINKSRLATMLIALYQAKRIKKYILKKIITHQSIPFILYSYWCDEAALGIALVKKNKPHVKSVSRIHGWDIFFERSTLQYLPFRHFICNSIDTIFSISEKGIDYAQSVWKVDTHNFKLSRLGVNKQSIIHSSENKIFTIVSCSSLIPIKRVHLIAEALPLLSSKIVLRWIHIGDGLERNKIESIIKTYPSNIEAILTGQIGNQEVIGIYKKFKPHVFINVSESEGIPVSIMEALSFGIPVIATDVGGTNEIVNNDNGWLIQANVTADDLSRLIENIYYTQSYFDKQFKAYQIWNVKYNASLNYNQFISYLLSK